MTPLFLIPGLGADRELFYPQLDCLGDRLTVLDDCGDESLWRQTPSMQTAANAYIDFLQPLISQNTPYVIGGMSFGGSLAMEMLQQIHQRPAVPSPARVLLIASNRTADTVSTSFRINRKIGSRLPRWMIQRSLGFASNLFARRESLDQDDSRRLRQMADRADIGKLLWGAEAIANWTLADDDIRHLAAVEQIHGRHDWVIPPTKRHVTETIDDGKHLITWTHRAQVNQWILAALES